MSSLICDRDIWHDSRRLRGVLSQSPRSTLLDHAAQCVAAMVGCSGDHETIHRNRVASLSTLLALAIKVCAVEEVVSAASIQNCHLFELRDRPGKGLVLG